MMEFAMRYIICILAIFLISCDANVEIPSVKHLPASDSDFSNIEIMAPDQNKQHWETIQLAVKSSELREAMRSGSTLFINIGGCGAADSTFPSVAFFEGIALDEQQKVVFGRLAGVDGPVVINGYVPSDFLKKSKDICVILKGGSYTGHSIRSNSIRLVG